MKRSTRLVLVLLAISALVMPFTALAQDDKDWQTFESEDGLLTVKYPADWHADELLDLGFPAFATANNEDVLADVMDTANEETPAESGQAAVQVLLFPVDVFSMLGVEVTDDMALDEVASAFITGLMGDDEDAAMNIGDPEIVELEDGPEIVVFPALDEEQSTEGIIVVYEVADGILLLGVGSTYVGEFDEDLNDVFVQIITSTEYTGTAEDLMMALMGGAMQAPETTPTPAQ